MAIEKLKHVLGIVRDVGLVLLWLALFFLLLVLMFVARTGPPVR